jgi:hypothetical protein
MIATTGTTATKKGGRNAGNESFFDRLGDLCKYRGLHGTKKVPRINAGLGNWVHYTTKRKVQGILPAHHVDALNGLYFEWMAGQSDRTLFED